MEDGEEAGDVGSASANPSIASRKHLSAIGGLLQS